MIICLLFFKMYELCCDMIDLLINMSEIYGQPNGNHVQSKEWTEANSNERSITDSTMIERISPYPLSFI